MQQERPFDLLNKSLGQQVLVRLKNGVSIRGKVGSFDMHMNMVIEDAQEVGENGDAQTKLGTILLRGGNIIFISPV
jgi:small nuclear ribonucleoprotein